MVHPLRARSPEAPFASAVAVRDLGRGLDWLEAVERLRGEAYPWWLDSARPGPPLGRYSFAGADPYLVMRARGARVELEGRRAARPDVAIGRSVGVHDPLDVLRALRPPPPATPPGVDLPWLGGAVGWLGYELAEWTEPVRLHGRDDLGLPDLALLFVDRLIALDHRDGRILGVGLGFDPDPRRAARRAGEAADAIAGRLERLGPSPPPSGTPSPILAADEWPAGVRGAPDAGRHAKAIREILGEIEAGNVYQADLTHALDVPFEGDAFALYRTLRAVSPAPFAAWLELPEASILSSSPERFLRLDADGRVESRPIKGTRPRGATPERDAALRAELAASPKDRAENLMIVDLVRNDLGRVCETGSVDVPELMAIEAYSSVFQMVSSVTGRLRADRDAVDLLRAAFPPGSMTGAPKLAAIRLLDRLEPVRRGVYSGAIGYFDVRGGLDLSVVIRTLIVTPGRARLHVGGGVVADSDPGAEWRETLDKARPLLAALARHAGA